MVSLVLNDRDIDNQINVIIHNTPPSLTPFSPLLSNIIYLGVNNTTASAAISTVAQHKSDCFDSDSIDSAEADGDHRARKRRNKQTWDDGDDDGLCSAPLEQPLPDSKVKIALSLYKVQQNIYLLDFQRVEVSLSQTAVEVIVLPIACLPYHASMISH